VLVDIFPAGDKKLYPERAAFEVVVTRSRRNGWHLCSVRHCT